MVYVSDFSLRRSIASAMYSLVFGWPPLSLKSPYLAATENFASRITSASVPGAFLVDFFPIMKYIPTWMAKWKREGLAWHDDQTRIFEGFYDSATTRTVSVPLCYDMPHLN